MSWSVTGLNASRRTPAGHETNSTILSGLEPLLTIEALAEYLDVPVTTIRDWRTDGKGPCAIRVGGRVRFAVSDVLSWLAAQREAEPGRGPKGR